MFFLLKFYIFNMEEFFESIYKEQIAAGSQSLIKVYFSFIRSIKSSLFYDWSMMRFYDFSFP